jgi:riboflavin transporter FmnP
MEPSGHRPQNEVNLVTNLRAPIVIAILAAASVILMATLQVPILPAAPYLRYDPSDVLALTAAFVLGPRSSVVVVALKDVLYLLLRARSIFGPLGNFIAVGTFVGIAGLVYHRLHSSGIIRLLVACGAGLLARVLIMIPANFILLYLQFGMPPAKVARIIWPVVVPFNAVAGLINAAITIVVMGAFLRTRIRTINPSRA